MKEVQKYVLWVSIPVALLFIICWIGGFEDWVKPMTVALALSVAIGIGSLPKLKSYQYTFWILAAIVCALLYPDSFLSIGGFDLRNKWLILIVVQLVMFGMGTQMSLKDFAGIRTMGKGVLVGIFCQFTIMPLIGYLLTRFFEFEPEIAAGVVLIGSCSSGLASNVMVYIAKANLTLSVTLTAVATLIAPIMTPLLMKIYAGTYVEVSFIGMFVQIIKIVIVPIGAAMLYDGLKTLSPSFKKKIHVISLISIFYLILVFFGVLPQSMLTEITAFVAGAIIFGVVFFYLTLLIAKLPQLMPLFSMFGIIYFTLVTTAASRDNILQIGLVLVVVAILHNLLGYTFGYWLSRAFKMDEQSARTIALEVGLQNGGMASGLAGVMGKLATLGLASAVFSPWMNVSGSLLANYWKRRR